MYLHEDMLQNLGFRELGYDFTKVINCRSLRFDGDEYEDAKLFDFIELLLIFTKSEKRSELEKRLRKIFDEEQKEFTIHDGLIVEKELTGIESITFLIKEDALRNKINEYYSIRRTGTKPNWILLSKISADIIQILFSAPSKKGDNKKYAESLCSKIAEKVTTKDRSKELTSLIDETVKNAKKLSNEIENIRHTDRSTIPIDTPSFHKIVASQNINLTELVILSLPELYIRQADPDKMKETYLTRYKVKKESGWVVKPEVFSPEDEIDPADIPF